MITAVRSREGTHQLTGGMWSIQRTAGAPRGQGKQQRASPRGQDSAAGAQSSLAASMASGSSSQVLWILIFFLGGYISL